MGHNYGICCPLLSYQREELKNWNDLIDGDSTASEYSRVSKRDKKLSTDNCSSLNATDLIRDSLDEFII